MSTSPRRSSEIATKIDKHNCEPAFVDQSVIAQFSRPLKSRFYSGGQAQRSWLIRVRTKIVACLEGFEKERKERQKERKERHMSS
ncbi:hypothetical protein MPTK1_1g04710 [Marchantia polymorpha subsp. ruderalis]|uniref:Uncharacterized protein n=2 Tax=Marchantia polymorpha TaxID=3197 RepID=A0AAF6ALJ1_MARPO|nr:hypothetical protein MARPO_0005s0137 [Marchantia polymorpha]BBM97311.1 hypothetical protein Mp_1g04710 [Marchantia polymorpha subsp. ruderalis]|eukprot:PTQ48496.1 hypothetical protein MARPO_0005s0137 [Marchantia polymorpha]